MPKLHPEDVRKIDAALRVLRDTKSMGHGTAFGEHYVLVNVMHECGIRMEFESGSHAEDVAAYISTYGRLPNG